MKIPRYKVLRNGKPIKVVVDLSFLIQSPTHDLVRWSRVQPLLFPEAFFFELFTHDAGSKHQKQQISAYRKFPHSQNLGARLPMVGNLLYYERKKQSPAGTALSHFEDGNFYLNPEMATGSYHFPKDCIAAINTWNVRVRNESTLLPRLTAVMLARFPKLTSCPYSDRQNVASEIMNNAATDDELIRSIYSKYAATEFPPAACIDRQWATFWRIRFLLMLCLKHFERYPSGNHKLPPAKEFDNEWLDIEYLVLGALAGGLASNDHKTIRRFFELACPQSWLFPA
jgi:hypothetical protein